MTTLILWFQWYVQRLQKLDHALNSAQVIAIARIHRCAAQMDVAMPVWNLFQVQYTKGLSICIDKCRSLKGHSEILWSEVYFSPHNLILLHSERAFLYSNLTSTGHLQKQSSFDKLGPSLYFWISDAQASEITVQYSMEKYNSCYPAYFTNVKL